ncbi:hypothetical protein COO20_24520 [Thalassospira marina]|uniref:Uncharacterized protein n=1 Tax=Thalassospira marina TaxID=2048283 RepID=A0A2N3KCZ3_9PROT|nr:hypothetical protein COO20_24520 [Thalassospira marina]
MRPATKWLPARQNPAPCLIRHYSCIKILLSGDFSKSGDSTGKICPARSKFGLLDKTTRADFASATPDFDK